MPVPPDCQSMKELDLQKKKRNHNNALFKLSHLPKTSFSETREQYVDMF